MDTNAQKSAREGDASAAALSTSGFDIWKGMRIAHRQAARNYRSGERRTVALLAQFSVDVDVEEG